MSEPAAGEAERVGSQGAQGDEKSLRKASEDETKKEEDARSIFVKVHFDTKKEQLEAIFEDCGTITRITLLENHGKPKGMAYVAFDSKDAVPHALMLSGTKLRNRQLKVNPKRTNIKGMSKYNKGPFDGMNGNMFNFFQQHLMRGHSGRR